MTTKTSLGGHLDFYREHGISPVHYQASNALEHFERRDSLYRSLGLPPLAFKGATVAEVAPGSGQNSLYVASRGPARFDLIEPNPSGRTDIEAAYAGFAEPHTKPTIHPQRLEEFEPDGLYDIVICENWLGSLPGERALIGKLARLVAPGGVLVMTVVPLSGFFPNIMRKLLALRLCAASLGFEERTSRLVEVFGPHLSTMKSMTRSHRDWVHDCMINPHYLHVGLPLPTFLGAIGAEFELLSTFPRFATDWRWFKALTGAARNFNGHALAAYRANALNFVDHRTIRPPSDEASAVRLDEAMTALYEAAVRLQQAGLSPDMSIEAPAFLAVTVALDQVDDILGRLAPDLGPALAELGAVWRKPVLDPAEIRGMQAFGALFGRETVYVSATRSLRQGAR